MSAYRARNGAATLGILHVYKDYPPVLGGIEKHVQALATRQAGIGHRVTVLVTDPGARTRRSAEDGVEVVRAGRLATLSSTPISVALVRELRRRRPDITHLHVPYPVGEGAWLLAGTRPMVVTYHSDVVRQRVLGKLWAPALRRVLGAAARILATSPNYVASSPFLQPRSSKIRIVSPGINPAPFRDAGRDRKRTASADGLSVVFVGRLRYYKGLGVLLDAMTRAQGFRLIVVGTGPMESEWRHLADRLGVASRVEWRGEVSEAELPSVYAAGDVFVLPAVARSEAFGIVQLEAMASGLPVITTDVGTGTSFVTVHGETGLVVPSEDPAALADALTTLLHDAALRDRMGRAGAARVEANFTEDAMLAAVETIYTEVLAE